MQKIKLYQIDAFANELFEGNPAAVCPLGKWLPDKLMQAIAAENNLAETAFVVPRGDGFEIRWFTPEVEVDLCGHATLAAAFVLFEVEKRADAIVHFYSQKSGVLSVFQDGGLLWLDFPADPIARFDATGQIIRCIRTMPVEIHKGRSDILVLLENEEDVAKLAPNLSEVAKLDARGLIVTAKGNETDFVSRFFAPQLGINEDPVTGSAHTTLVPYWAAKLGRSELTARQLSQRGGRLFCRLNGNRVLIGGKAVLYLTGEIQLV